MIAIFMAHTVGTNGRGGNRLIRCEGRLEVAALPGVPLVRPGDDLAALLAAALERAKLELGDGDVIVVTSKVVSRAAGRFVDLATVAPSERARALAAETGKDPRLVELVLGESSAVSRKARGVLVTRHRLGFVAAHAGIDLSNSLPEGAPPGSGPWALLLPERPDEAARSLRAALEAVSGARIGVVVSDSFGRPFRLGTVGAAIGCAGLPPLWDRRGERDLHGRTLEITMTALADQVAAAADLVAGQADEGRPFVLVRGLAFDPSDEPAVALLRRPDEDLYA
jgi:coenzyme F420-0:L-glutamate ligase/coenzyme F420-1:gamma-L-glutamate ligase